MTANFNAAQSYNWLIAEAGQITGFDPDAFVIDTSAFQNAFDGTFALSQQGNGLWLTYQAAVPEPASWLMASIGMAALVAYSRRRRSRRSSCRDE
jgi:hypothetical protein